MKKKWTTQEGKLYYERRRRKQEKRTLASKYKQKLKLARNYKDVQELKEEEKTERGEISVKVTHCLDPLDENSELVKVCQKIQKWKKKNTHDIFIDLLDMKRFTLAGAIYLSASISSNTKGAQKINVAGNLPKEKNVASNFLESGFFNNLIFENRNNLPHPTSVWTNAEETKVVGAKAAKLVQFAEKYTQIPDEQKKAIWQNLVECMMNTNNHATGEAYTRSIGKRKKSKKRNKKIKWIAGVMCQNDTAYFAFVDQGVGICKSADARNHLLRAGTNLSGYGARKIVKEAFEGKLGSSTRERGRGLGLPRMRRDAKNKLLQDLQIRTGMVAGKIDTMEFRRTSEDLQGTILTWAVYNQ